MTFENHCHQIQNKKNLSIDESYFCFQKIFSDELSSDAIKDFLIFLYQKGETVDELIGAVKFLREQSVLKLDYPNSIDCCGTGGDQKNTFNISTAVAFVLAGGGLKVAKHGNRSVSSKSGSSDVLEALGIDMSLSPEASAKCLDELGLAFFFAPSCYPLLKKVAAIRKSIPHRTVFNLLGPLLNPVGAQKQLIGVYHSKYVALIAKALEKLQTTSAIVVSSEDGLDEFSLTAKANVAKLYQQKLKEFVFDPRESGYSFCEISDLKGGDAKFNADRLKLTLKGHSRAIDHVVHINAAWGFVAAEKAQSFMDGLLMAQDSISSGRAYQKLQDVIHWTKDHKS